MTNIDWEEKRLIDDAVDNLSFTRVTRFYPTIVHKITGVPLSDVFNYLVTMVEDNRLTLQWEIRCPNITCNDIVLRVENIADYLNQPLTCDECESEFDVRGNIVFPVFKINDGYRKSIRKSKKKQKNLLKTF